MHRPGSIPFWQQPIETPSCHQHGEALKRQDLLTKPPGSLGQLEVIACRLSAQQNRPFPSLSHPWISVFAADHGIANDGVSLMAKEVTAQMINNFLGGGAGISVLADEFGAHLEVIDTGVATPFPDHPALIRSPIAAGTGNIRHEPAMTGVQLEEALAIGDEAARRAHQSGADLYIAGEMGIGNTSATSAVAAALLDQPARAITGRGSGLDTAGVARKTRFIEQALERHGNDGTPFAVLASLGGFEIAAMAGSFIGAARRGIPVLVDGFIASTAVLAALRMNPSLYPWLHFGHCSGESGHRLLLEALEATPILDMGMRLGEGTGAAMAIPVLKAACALHSRMATFGEAGVTEGG
ncbi:nicotinate-nucleotide--dimethylbenzimidazole phosphoribosyltransferase [Halospina sp. K52047b]|uniref:nicotinate-nucleotide--dimethylbenzimidazole phosphoribosyltransferase n=1 Tax=Halospina sp. K52047b TaxID=2614160 RepID=UPI00124A3DDC|nr:nicotinate-nucleotide--dimethylbenzimidazole phosphoribosyltransferase [Halospina sp. K52047b]KAA8977795.1 nicotinate-nucleotide--dimethylbenzimidazole phosphoribosyltransferase [Halospina sp. K52047b]